MPKFRKRPVVIEATQWFKMGDHPAVFGGWQNINDPAELGRLMPDSWLSEPRRPLPETFRHVGVIETLEGWHVVSPGDWIIKGVQGELYPCKPDIFAATYEDAEPIPFDEPLEPPDKRPSVASLTAEATARGDMNEAVARITQEIMRLAAPITAAARVLLDAIDRLNGSPLYQAVWTLYHVHGGSYTGPSIYAETESLRTILKERGL